MTPTRRASGCLDLQQPLPVELSVIPQGRLAWICGVYACARDFSGGCRRGDSLYKFIGRVDERVIVQSENCAALSGPREGGSAERGFYGQLALTMYRPRHGRD